MTTEIRVTSPTGDIFDALVTASEMRNTGSPVWDDATTPKTDRPVRFHWFPAEYSCGIEWSAETRIRAERVA